MRFPGLLLLLFAGALLIGFPLESYAKDKKETKKEARARKRKEKKERKLREQEQREEDVKNLSPKQAELQRVREVMEWFKKTGPKRKEYLAKYYAPVIAGTEKAVGVFNKRAAYFKKKSMGKGKKSRREEAKKASALCLEYSALNKKIAESIKIDKLEGYSTDCEKLVTLEKTLNPLLGKHPIERKWFTRKEYMPRVKKSDKKKDDKSDKDPKKKKSSKSRK